MCLCIPSSVVSVDNDNATAKVETLGVIREVSISLIDEPVEVGEHLLIHVGFAISKINQQEAEENLKMYQSLLSEMEQDHMQVML
ncbi:HypC/HybG/HupF family hydrogenase formation chaperone [Vibrio tritonius]|uniref:HypC/HybG/HupF family hydrogenase formation chaperone n=2 Tax=Vibrio TaxID=662 RepID=A0ABS7YMG3_9VIBR|nr:MULTISPECIES: HypC/HybG/HupF family hydrogenase formation chaperone [Vibrio]MCA2016041.1 HypC/HybG/HupF family hydrogenase formation chaperone [Vibrio tritonius]WPC74532.1 HypC/HybG/HupF family hydrogenase formation chaperone [Vibrio porteresiae DSM 19223]